MTSHVFGAKSSACIASHAIHCAITEAEKQGKISEDSADMAHAVMKGGFRLTKWLSNERKVIESFDKDKRADAVKEFSLDDSLLNKRTLGLMLNIESDHFYYNTHIPGNQ